MTLIQYISVSSVERSWREKTSTETAEFNCSLDQMKLIDIQKLQVGHFYHQHTKYGPGIVDHMVDHKVSLNKF
jgi:hypothetical protein